MRGKGHTYKTQERANEKRMPFILDTGSKECIIASADIRKLRPETVVQRTLAVIQGVIGHQLSLLGPIEILIRLTTDCVVLVRFLAMQRGTTLLGREAMKQLSVSITLKAI